MRVQRTAGGTVTRWVYGPDGNPIMEAAETSIREFVYAEGKLLGYWETVGGVTQKYFTLTDQVGSVVSTADELGTEVLRRNYLAFGAEAGVEGDYAAPALYTGKEWDAEAGLYYHNARWYDPELGRFISEDPIMDGPNWYAYCGNSPLMRTDPTGLFDPDEKTEERIANLKAAQDLTRGNPNYAPGAGGPFNLPGDNKTWCNQATYDVLEATGFKLSMITGSENRWTTRANEAAIRAEPSENPRKRDRQLVQLTPEKAQEMANNGWSVVAVHRNDKGPGHLATIRPSAEPYDPTQGPLLSTVGAETGLLSTRDVFKRKMFEVVYYYDSHQTFKYDGSKINRSWGY